MAAPLPSEQARLPNTQAPQAKIAGNNTQKKQPAAATSSTSRQWSDLFKAKSKPSRSFQLNKWDEDKREIKVEELRDIGVCLVGFILGRFPGMQAVDKVRQAWGVEHSFTIHESGWLVFRFSSEQECDEVLQKGPYDSNGSSWILKKMPQFFSFNHDYFNSIPTWIRLQGLPLDFWSAPILGKLASYIGEPIAADECTAELLKTSYARLLVEVDITKPLVRNINFRLPDGTSFTQDVVYEREPRFCSTCRMMGHNILECRRAKAQSLLQTARANKSTAPMPAVSPANLPLGDRPIVQARESAKVVSLPTKAGSHATDDNILPAAKESNQILSTGVTEAQSVLDTLDKGKSKVLEDVMEEECSEPLTPMVSLPTTSNITQLQAPAIDPEKEALPQQLTSDGEAGNAEQGLKPVGQRRKQNKKTRSGKVRGPNQPSPT